MASMLFPRQDGGSSDTGSGGGGGDGGGGGGGNDSANELLDLLGKGFSGQVIIGTSPAYIETITNTHHSSPIAPSSLPSVPHSA